MGKNLPSYNLDTVLRVLVGDLPTPFLAQVLHSIIFRVDIRNDDFSCPTHGARQGGLMPWLQAIGVEGVTAKVGFGDGLAGDDLLKADWAVAD